MFPLLNPRGGFRGSLKVSKCLKVELLKCWDMVKPRGGLHSIKPTCEAMHCCGERACRDVPESANSFRDSTQNYKARDPLVDLKQTCFFVF